MVVLWEFRLFSDPGEQPKALAEEPPNLHDWTHIVAVVSSLSDLVG